MKSRIVLALILFLTSVCTYDILVGSFSKGTFEDDQTFKSCSAIFQQRMMKEYGDTISNSILKIATYSQIVNGINYKFLSAYKDPKSNSIKLVDGVVYTGPFSTFLNNPSPSLSSIMVLPSETLNMGSNDVKTNNILTQINTVVKTYATANIKDLTFKNIKDIQTFNHYMYNENYYLATAVFNDASNGAKEVYFVVSENNAVFSVVKHTF